MAEIVFLWLKCFAFALVFELPIILLFVRGRVAWFKTALVVVAANLLTQPALWLLAYAKIIPESTAVFVGGPLSVLVEALVFSRLLRPLGWRRATAGALLANLAGFAMVALFVYALRDLGYHDKIARWAISFIFTLIIEMPLYALLAGSRIPTRRALIAAFLCTAVTHPLLIFVWRGMFTDYTAYIISGELLVAIIESLIFYAVARPIQFFQAVSVAFFANAASYFWGHLLRITLRQML